MSDVLFSVIMPALNQERFIATAIESVLTQTCRDLELIIIDDGSTDDTQCIVKRYRRDPRVVLISQENRGVSAARNRGLSCSSGKLVAFLDADDFWPPGWLATTSEILEADDDITVVVGPRRYVNETGEQTPASIEIVRDSALQPLSMLLSNPIATPAVVARRPALLSVGGFDPELAIGEDQHLWLRLMGAGFRFRAIPAPAVNIRIHSENTLGRLPLFREHLLKLQEKLFGGGTVLSPEMKALENAAYAQTHLSISLLALRLGQLSLACSDFHDAIRYSPSLRKDLNVWFAVSCAEQRLGYQGTAEMLDLIRAASNVEALLSAIALGSEQAESVLDRQTRATAYTALGRVAYSLRGDHPTSIRYLTNALIADFETAAKQDAARFLVRALLGRRMVAIARSIRQYTVRTQHG